MEKKGEGSDGGHHHCEGNRKRMIPFGTSDVLGDDMRAQKRIISIIQGVYERFGFSPLDTPILENACVFDGHHGEGEEILFHLQDKGSDPLVLRYDLTVPCYNCSN